MAPRAAALYAMRHGRAGVARLHDQVVHDALGHVASRMVHLARCMLHWCILHVASCIGVYCMLHVAWCILHIASCIVVCSCSARLHDQVVHVAQRRNDQPIEVSAEEPRARREDDRQARHQYQVRDVHLYAPTCANTHARPRVHTRTRAHMCQHARAPTRAHTHARPHAPERTPARADVENEWSNSRARPVPLAPCIASQRHARMHCRAAPRTGAYVARWLHVIR